MSRYSACVGRGNEAPGVHHAGRRCSNPLPFAVRAQQPAVPVIGLMGVDSAESQSRMTAAFVQRLRELGWTEGRNVIIEYRWAAGHTERFADIAAEFTQRNVSIILTHNTPPT